MEVVRGHGGSSVITSRSRKLWSPATFIVKMASPMGAMEGPHAGPFGAGAGAQNGGGGNVGENFGPQIFQHVLASILVRGGRKDRKFQFFAFLGLIFNSADRFLTFFSFSDIFK